MKRAGEAQSMVYLKRRINQAQLMTLEELKAFFRAYGEDGEGMAKLQERYRQRYGADLIVQYPFGTYGYEGAYFVPLHEGIACLRYNIITLDRGPKISMDASEFVDRGSVIRYMVQTKWQTRRLLTAFSDMRRLLVGETWGRGLIQRLAGRYREWKARSKLPF